jgi:protein dithiol oxidoreductase (disulfide-forming)
MFRLITLTALLSLALCSCARSAPPHPITTTPKPVLQAAVPPSPPQTASDPATVQSEAIQATAAQEKGDAATEDDPRAARGDAGLERLAQLPADQALPASHWKPGLNYDPLVPSQPTSVGPGKVEVVEVFWLGCPHCAALEPYIQSWLKNKPAYIEFVRVPVMWGPVHRAHAKLFYTLMALNRPDLLQKGFDAIQQQHEMLAAPNEDDTLKAQLAFATANGVPADKFTAAYNSFSVATNLQRAEGLTQRYHVEGVPLIVIDGKYTTDVAKAGSQSNLIQIIDDLAASERRH